MKLSKAEREQVRQKFGGRCAYCGCDLPDRWHADHVEPVKRGCGSYWSGKPAMYMENHRIDNILPSCPPCNINKASMSLEVWREWIGMHVASLHRYSSNYRIAKAFGLIQETGAPVIFYFERQG